MESFKHGNKLSAYKTGEEFRDQMSDYRLLSNDSAPCSWLL